MTRTVAEAIKYADTLCAGPAVLMLLGSAMIFLRSPSDTVVHCTQVRTGVAIMPSLKVARVH